MARDTPRCYELFRVGFDLAHHLPAARFAPQHEAEIGVAAAAGGQSVIDLGIDGDHIVRQITASGAIAIHAEQPGVPGLELEDFSGNEKGRQWCRPLRVS
jgi:hypothetical protein